MPVRANLSCNKFDADARETIAVLLSAVYTGIDIMLFDKVHCACKSRARCVRRAAPVCGASRSSRNNLAYTPSADRRQASENTEVANSNRGAGRDIRARLRIRAHSGARRRATAARHGARSRASARRSRAASPASASGGRPGRARRSGRHSGRVADSRRAASPRNTSGGRQIHRPKRPHQYGGKPG